MKYTAKEIAKTLGDESSLGDGGWKCRCPAHADKTASLSVRDSRGKILVRCHAGCDQDRVIDSLRDLDLWPRAERKATWTPISPVPDDAPRPKGVKHFKHGEPKRHWVYKDSEGRLIGYIFRFEEVGSDGKVSKTTLPMSYCESDDGRREWSWKSFNKPRPMYGLEDLAKRPKDPVVVVEGEKAADAARELFPDHVCVSWPGGSKAVKYVDFKPLIGRDVKLWPDADAPGRTAMAQAGEILFAEGVTKIRVVPVPEWVDDWVDPNDPENLGKGWDVADDALPGMPSARSMLDDAKPFSPGSDDVIEQLNRRYAFVILGGKGAVLRETTDHQEGKVEITYLSPDGFNQFFSNSKVPVGRGFVPAGKYWMSHEDRRTYEGVTFMPGRNMPGYYNLWRGFTVEPVRGGDYSMFREHLFENAAQGNHDHFNWIFAWFAQMFQQPHFKPGTSLSFRGKQGTGKTIIGKIFGHLMRSHYTLVSDSRYLFGQFNSHMASTILLHSDESFWAGDPRHVGKLRDLVTGETHRIEYKSRDTVEVGNFMRLLITTNQDFVVPAAVEERRFAVFDMGPGRQQDKAYFVEMQRQLRDGGYAGLLYDLMHFDLNQVEVGVIPKTSALRDQKETAMSDVAKFWMYCLMEGEILPSAQIGWPGTVSSDRLFRAAIDQLELWGKRYRPTPLEFAREIKQLCPPDTMKSVRHTVAGKPMWCVALPDLQSAREHFDELHDTKFEWKVDPVKVEHEVAPDIPF